MSSWEIVNDRRPGRIRLRAPGPQGPSGDGGAPVQTVFGRFGSVVAQSGDYTAAQIAGFDAAASAAAPVQSVAGRTGAVTIGTADVAGLDTALAGKISTVNGIAPTAGAVVLDLGSLQGVSLPSTISTGYVLKWTGSQWEPRPDEKEAVEGGGPVPNSTYGDVGVDGTTWTVLKIQGRSIHTAAPSGGQALVWDAANARWAPTTLTVTAIDGLTSQLAAKVGTSRQVIAGTGLTGGGDLSADRTLAVTFGSGSGTACEGNDSRLTNSRTPTAHAATHATGGSDAISPASIGAAASSHTHAVGDLTQSGAATGQAIVWNGSTWAPATVATGPGGGVTQIDTGAGLTGGPITSTGQISVTFAANGSSTRAVRSDDSRLTDARAPSGNAGGDLTGTYPNPSLATVGTAGTYTKITTDAKGRVTSGGSLSSGDLPSHGHAIGDVTGLQDALNGKAPNSHTHTIADVTGLQTALDGKASSTHNHAIGDVTGLQTALDSKAASTHSHAITDVTGLQTALDGKAPNSHTHTASAVTDFAEAVDDRVAALLQAGSNVTLNYDDANNTLTISATGKGEPGTGGAPTGASYVTLGTNGDLTAERVLTAGTGISINDAGANAAVTVAVQYGTTSTTACVGNDARLSDARTPTSHTHGLITNGGSVSGASANRVVTTTDNGVITTIATGAAGTVLTVAEGGTLSWTTPSGSPSGAGTKTLARFTALDAQPPSTAFATLDTVNTMLVLEFDDSVEESTTFVGVIPEGANLSSGLRVNLHWISDGGEGQACRWGVQFYRFTPAISQATYSYETAVYANTTATVGVSRYMVTTIDNTNLGTLAAGDVFRLRVIRDGGNAADTMTGDAQLFAVEIRGIA